MAVFNEIADSYDGWYNSKLGSFVDTVETGLAFKLFKVKKGMTVLDVGCGTGNFSIKLANLGCKVTGIDISDRMLDLGRKKARSLGLDIEFYSMDVYDMAFKDDHFDAAFSMAAFEFITKPEKAVEEMFRVTKTGGAILIGTINKDSRWGELYIEKGRREDSDIFRYAHFKTPDDLKELKKDKLINYGQCLFIPPDIAEEEINMERELELSKTERGGFICALWKK